MKRSSIVLAYMLLARSLIPSAYSATPVPVYDSLFYYDLGGAEPISFPPAPILTTINLSFKVSPSGLSCGSFDPQISVENFFDDLKSGADQMMGAMQNAATAAIAALPGYLLQKANPTLYDIFQNGLLRSWSKFSLATKSCEQMMNDMNSGIDPYEKWVTLSAGDAWKIQAGAGGADIVDVRQQIAANKGNAGLDWVGGVNCGGKAQAPCRPLRDIASAGFNLSTGRAATTATPIPTTPASPELVKLWNSPQDVRDWIEEVIGDDEIRTCQDCDRGSVPGRGLIPMISDRAAGVEALLRDMVGGVLEPTRTNLDRITAPGMGISLQVIQSIRDIPDAQERGNVSNKLATEIASAQVIEEALVMKRLLLTGRKEANVNGVAMAQEEVSKGLAELDAEIKNVIFEKEVRSVMVGDSVKKLLHYARAINTASTSQEKRIDLRQRELNNGRVLP